MVVVMSCIAVDCIRSDMGTGERESCLGPDGWYGRGSMRHDNLNQKQGLIGSLYLIPLTECPLHEAQSSPIHYSSLLWTFLHTIRHFSCPFALSISAHDIHKNTKRWIIAEPHTRNLKFHPIHSDYTHWSHTHTRTREFKLFHPSNQPPTASGILTPFLQLVT